MNQDKMGYVLGRCCNQPIEPVFGIIKSVIGFFLVLFDQGDIDAVIDGELDEVDQFWRWCINIDTPLLLRFEAEFEHCPPPIGVRTSPPERSSPHSDLKIGFMHQRRSSSLLQGLAIRNA